MIRTRNPNNKYLGIIMKTKYYPTKLISGGPAQVGRIPERPPPSLPPVVAPLPRSTLGLGNVCHNVTRLGF